MPSAKECQERVEKFAEIANTDKALAQFYLQDRDWDALAEMTLSVIATILERKTDVVLLQEVIDFSYEILKQKMPPEYLITEGKGKRIFSGTG